MARIRSIKPEFWEDEEVSSLTRDARLLYIATWNCADDEGLLRWTPPYLKSAAFIYDDDLNTADVELLMGELVECGFVFPYVAGKARQKLGWIPSFRAHQKPNRPQPSKLPPPSLQNSAVRYRYAERDKWVCHICGEEIPRNAGAGNCYDHDYVSEDLGLQMDHVKPRVEGGSDYPTNIKAAHAYCNRSKGRSLAFSVNDAVNHSVNDAVSDSPTCDEPFTTGGEGSGGVGEWRGNGEDLSLSSSVTETGPVDNPGEREGHISEELGAVVSILQRQAAGR